MYDLSNHAISDDLAYCNLFKCDSSYSCAAVDRISTDGVSRGPSARAELHAADTGDS